MTGLLGQVVITIFFGNAMAPPPILVSFGTLIPHLTSKKNRIRKTCPHVPFEKILIYYGEPKKQNVKIPSYGGLRDAKRWEDSKSGLEI